MAYTSDAAVWWCRGDLGEETRAPGSVRCQFFSRTRHMINYNPLSISLLVYCSRMQGDCDWHQFQLSGLFEVLRRYVLPDRYANTPVESAHLCVSIFSNSNRNVGSSPTPISGYWLDSLPVTVYYVSPGCEWERGACINLEVPGERWG